MSHKYSLNSSRSMGTCQRESDLSLNHWWLHQYSPPLYIRNEKKRNSLGYWLYNIVSMHHNKSKTL